MELAILFGGASYEHEISIVSAITLKEKLNRFDLTCIFCDQDHTFYEIPLEKMKAKTFSSKEFEKFGRLTLVNGGFEQQKRFSKKVITSSVLNLIHGADGEDGTIASLLDFYKINYIGPRADVSVLSFDKLYTKWLATSLNIKSVDYKVIEKGSAVEFPLIIKPARLGSSIGVSIVKNESELEYALDVAFEYDSKVLVEPFINGVKEYNVAGCKTADGIVHSIVEEPQKSEFLDFDKKYLDFSRSSTVNEADLAQDDVKKLYEAFDKIYNFGFDGALIRCDFFMIDGEVYLNEINPIPGSMANYLFDDFQSVIEKLLQNLPKKSSIKVAYQYLHSISSAKGK